VSTSTALSHEDLARLRACSALRRQPLAELAGVRSTTPAEAARLLAKRLDLRFVDAEFLSSAKFAADRLPLALAQQLRCAVVRAADGAALCIVSDPFDDDLALQVRARTGARLEFALATVEDIQSFLQYVESQSSALEVLGSSANDAVISEADETLSFAAVAEAGSEASRVVASTLLDAQRLGASDVHFETTATGLLVRYRIDGVLEDVARKEGHTLPEQIVSRVKVMANLDIAEHRIPQDGSFRVRVQERDIDMRVSVMPSVHGEDVVIRILDKRTLVEAGGRLTLDALGFDATTLASLRQLLDEPYGMTLVTGPTGSGKTTTLYAALSELHSGREKIVTIEDPVEYQLQGMLQIPVNEKKKLTFALGLRSILRHDPDVIMVGEIRDKETAEIAVQSALTGHLVLSTVHANSVFDVFGRFAHMGLDSYALVSAVNGVWAQRLVRVNCPHCLADDRPDPRVLERLRLDPAAVAGWRARRGAGCMECRGTGFRGRRAIAEVLRVDAEVGEMLVAKAPMPTIRDHAIRRQGMRSMIDAGLELVKSGVTTLEEIRRVAVAD
jgi:general secretion pathway protein E